MSDGAPSGGPSGAAPGASPGELGQGDPEELMKQLSQSGGANTAAGSSAIPGLGAGAGGPGQSPAKPQQPPPPPRPIGQPLQEAGYIAKDIAKGVGEFLPQPLASLLGVQQTDTPEQQAKKRQMHQQYQRMTGEQQRYVQQKLQQEQQRKQQQEEEVAMRRQQEEAARAQAFEMPQGKRTGDINMAGQGSQKAKVPMTNKNRAEEKLKRDRQTLSSAG